jgi:hypothetical protein
MEVLAAFTALSLLVLLFSALGALCGFVLAGCGFERRKSVIGCAALAGMASAAFFFLPVLAGLPRFLAAFAPLLIIVALPCAAGGAFIGLALCGMFGLRRRIALSIGMIVSLYVATRIISWHF